MKYRNVSKSKVKICKAKFILSSLIILEYGKWYRKASGLLTFAYTIKIYDKNDVKNIFLKSLLIFWLKKLNFKPNINININTRLLINKFNGKKKFKNKAKKPNKIKPKIPFSS